MGNDALKYFTETELVCVKTAFYLALFLWAVDWAVLVNFIVLLELRKGLLRPIVGIFKREKVLALHQSLRRLLGRFNHGLHLFSGLV